MESNDVEILATVNARGILERKAVLRSVELVDRAHVTRLQAEIKDLLHNSVKGEVFEVVCKERDALKAEVERMTVLLHDRSVHIGALDSELTKALELLTCIRGQGLNPVTAAAIRTFLAHQSAPAAKCDHARKHHEHGGTQLRCSDCGEACGPAAKGEGDE